MATVSYTRMADMTAADVTLLSADQDEEARELPDRLMKPRCLLTGLRSVANGLGRQEAGHSLPLEFFRPIVEEAFSRPRHAADDFPAP